MYVRRVLAVGSCIALVLALSAVFSGPASAASAAYSWGWNEFGQLGIGTTLGESNAPAPIQGLSEVSAISGGSRFALALLSGGTVDSWGEGSGGRLGAPVLIRDVPTAIGGLSEVTAIAAGSEFGMALLSDGTVEAWGDNGGGELGDGGIGGERFEPAPVSGLSEVTAIAAGARSGYALLRDGTVMAWGVNGSGQLGDGSKTGSGVPVAVSDLSGVTSIAAGAAFGLALLEGGEVRSWGTDAKGEMGNGEHEAVDHPEVVGKSSESPLQGVRAIAAGDEHALALLEDETVVGWGNDANGEIGTGENGGPELFISVPAEVKELKGATAVAAGGNHSLAVVAGGSVMAWGGDELGELGNGESRKGLNFYAPVSVACGLSGASSVSAGFWTGFAVGDVTGYDCPLVAEASPGVLPPTGGTTVTITGSNFAGATAVVFETWEGTRIPAKSFEVDSSSEITAVSPFGEAGEIRVTTPAGTSAPNAGAHVEYEFGVGALTPDFGPVAGGTLVRILGDDFKEAEHVAFGSTPATSFKVVSLREIQALAPAGKGTVDVTVTTPLGTTKTSANDAFTYLEGPEYGRCKATDLHLGGQFKKSSCTQPTSNSGYEWYPASLGSQPLAHRGFTLAGGAVKLETASKTSITCTAETGAGEYSGGRTVAATLALTGCKKGSGTCQSEGAAAGEVRSAALTGWLGVISAKGAKDKVGLQLGPSTGEVVAAFSCEAAAVTIRGSVIFEAKSADKMSTSFSLKAKGSKGAQKLTRFEGGPEAALQAKFGAGGYEGVGLTAAATQTSEEAVEIDTEL